VQFLVDGDVYRVVRITGPTHNMLGLKFVTGDEPNDLKLEPLSSDADVQGATLRPDEIRHNVLEGVADANRTLGTNYRVGLIQFLPSDSPPVVVYRELARRLVERIVRGE